MRVYFIAKEKTPLLLLAAILLSFWENVPITYSIDTIWMEKQKVYMFHICLKIATLLKTGLYIYIYISF